MSQQTIYALIDPKTKTVKYIGKTSSRLSQRYASHIYYSKTSKDSKGAWIRNLIKKGLRPELKVIEVVSSNIGNEREASWIQHYKDAGAELVNETKGGDGIKGYRHSKETKRKIGEASRCMARTIEHGRKLSEGKVGTCNPQSKLNPADIEKIKELLAQGVKQKAIADCFHITQSHVSRIKTGAYLKRCRFNTIFGGIPCSMTTT